jgi:tetratricopeptide (TPR) repeat protein
MRWPKGCEFSDFHDFGTVFPPSLGYSTEDMDPYGGGDEVGLYWPIGQEKRQPLVVRTFHETFELAPFFSSYQRYLRWMKKTQSDDLPMSPDEKLDPDSPEVLYNQGLSLIKAKDVPKALEIWQQALDRLPEFTLVSSLLAKHHRRLKNLDLAREFALKSLISPPSFGRFDASLLKWLGRQTSPPEAYAENPLWLSRRKLQWGYRGKKNDYEIVQEAIDCFLETGQPVLGVTLMQTYSEFMYRETDSTKKRWKFDSQEWTQHQDEMCVKYLKSSRWPGGRKK